MEDPYSSDEEIILLKKPIKNHISILNEMFTNPRVCYTDRSNKDKFVFEASVNNLKSIGYSYVSKKDAKSKAAENLYNNIFSLKIEIKNSHKEEDYVSELNKIFHKEKPIYTEILSTSGFIFKCEINKMVNVGECMQNKKAAKQEAAKGIYMMLKK
jgi:dsRNA-specific ribonuclease